MVIVGYKVEEGMLELGREVILKRDSDSFPEYFNEELNIEDAIIVRKYKNEFEQAEKVADEILQNLQEDELEADDILIILPEPYTSRSKYSIISDALKRRKIYSHLVGIDTTADQVFIKNSIAVTHIFRAKGNGLSVFGDGLGALESTLFVGHHGSRKESCDDFKRSRVYIYAA